jgi:hypothetical protein
VLSWNFPGMIGVLTEILTEHLPHTSLSLLVLHQPSQVEADGCPWGGGVEQPDGSSPSTCWRTGAK